MTNRRAFITMCIATAFSTPALAQRATEITVYLNPT